MPLFGPPNVEKMLEKHDVRGLIRALNDPQVHVCLSAVRALEEICDPIAVEPLIATLKGSNNSSVRIEVIFALEKIGKPATEPLIAVLKDGNYEVRGLAAKTLGKIGDTRAVGPLIAALKDVIWEVCLDVVWALGEIGDRRGVEPLITVLKDANKNVRIAAVQALGKIGDLRAVDPLIAIFKDEDKNVRLVAATALEKIGKPVVEPLIAVLEDADKNVRLYSATVLGDIGDPRAVEPLIAILKDADKNVRKSVVKALGVLRDARAIDSLIALLDSEEETDVCNAATTALKKIGYPNGGKTESRGKKRTRLFIRNDSAQLPWDFWTEFYASGSAKAKRQIGRYEVETVEIEYEPRRDLPRRIMGTAWSPILASKEAEIHIFVRNILCKLSSGIRVTDVSGGVYMQFLLDFDAGYIEIWRLRQDQSVFRFGQDFPDRIQKALQTPGTVVVVDFINPDMPQVVEN